MKSNIKKLLQDAEAKGYWVVPGLIDMHVHFRDPGLTHKEDIRTGLKAAAAGGFTTVITMANTAPVCDNKKVINYQKAQAKKAKLGRLLPICAVTKNMEGKQLVKTKNFAYSDDGKQISNSEIMEAALAKKMPVLAHYDEPEHELIKRDIAFAIKHNARLHIQHVSTERSVNFIRAARKTHPHLITAEAAPHHFTLTESAIKTHGTNAKMAPPLRTKADVEAIIKALADDTISVIATDHAPHASHEKAADFSKAPNGIIGLETAVALTLTNLYHTGKLTKAKVIEKLSTNPAKILGLNFKNDFTIIDPNFEWTVDSKTFSSKSKNQPYDGTKLKGKVLLTICKNKVIYGTLNVL